MPLFSYRAIDRDGRLVRGRIQAADLGDLELRLQRMALDLVNGESTRTPLGGSRVPRRELMHFCFHLEQLLNAGVPILEALDDLRDAITHPGLRAATAEVLDGINGGASFSAALAAQPRVFDRVFCALARAGEMTGRLPQVLAQIHETLKREDELAAYARRLAIYPTVVLLAVSAALLVSLALVVPELAKLFASTGQQLPLSTRILIACSDFLTRHYAGLLLAIALGAGACAWAWRTYAAVRFTVDRWRLSLPVLGEVYRKITLARFASLFAMSYASGITVLEGLRMAREAAGNRFLRHALQRVEALVTEGQNLTQAFGGVGLFPGLVVRMLRVGETTGALDQALGNVSDFYERDVRESVLRLQALLEPLLTVLLGGVLLWVMLSVLGPIYDIITRMAP